MTSGNRPAPEQGSWHIPGAANAYEPSDDAEPGPGRGRPGLVALVVALVELAIIAAACNQAVSKHAFRYFADHETSFLGRTVGSSLEFTWRVAPRSGDNRGGHHVWASQLVVIAVFVVLSALLAGLAVRGTVTFWRAFFGVWTAVLAAAFVAHVAGAFVTKPQTAGTGRASAAVFNSVDGLTLFAGAVIGLVAALVAALMAIATRRAVERPVAAAAPPEPAYVPESPPPFYGNAPQPQQAPQQAQTQNPPAPSPEADGRTTQIPRFDPRGGQQWTPPAGEAQTTAALPADDGGATQALPRTTDQDRPADERRDRP